jgi:hypothetical protein
MAKFKQAMISESTKLNFFELLNGEKTVLDFEKWVYQNSIYLENDLHDKLYIDFISFNYKQKDSFTQLKYIIFPLIDIDEFNIWRTKKLLADIIENKIDLVLATKKLRNLYYETDEVLIPITLGIGYESVLDDVPLPKEYYLWNKETLMEKLDKVELYKDNILSDAKDFLLSLNKK